MAPASSRAFLSSAIAVLAMAAGFSTAVADGLLPHRHPNLLERIMEPIVREVQLSQMAGPEKRSFWNDDDPLLNKMRLQSVLAPVAGHSAVVADSGFISKNKEEKGSETNSYQPTAREKKELRMAIGTRVRRSVESSGVGEPLSALSHVGRDHKGFNVMKFFYNNFMVAPPVANMDFVPLSRKAAPGLPSVIRLEDKVKSVVSESNSSSSGGKVNVTDIKPVSKLISVDFEVFAFPNPAAIAAKRNSTKVGGLGGLYLPGAPGPFPQLPTNRSSYSKRNAFSVQYVAFVAAAAPTSPPLETGTPMSTSKSFTKISLLVMLLVVACSISCVLGSALPFVQKRVSGPEPTIWVTKSGKKIPQPWARL